jgi:chemosensory pili system protein ChpA (sensor histidine kinase/response regulator)
MNIRLVKVETISDRLYKITRNTSKELSKRVNLELFGEKTEMDRLLLDKIISPIEHLLRNCIAHGVESPEQRVAAGKAAIGNITIKTSLEGNFIVVAIKDDGAGINVEKVREIGLKKHLIKANHTYSEKEIVELIFQPGFSTADSVSQVAGRGVGMEIVKNDITALGGSITIDTVAGKGSTFTLILPVAVATNQAMLTENMGKLVAIPALLVSEVISIKQVKLQEAYKNGYITHRDKQLPLMYMGHLMGLLPAAQNPEIKTYNTLIAVSYLDQTLVVHVDKLKTTSEILIKSMGAYLGKVSGILGATILGDGRQGTVINPVLLKTHYDKYIKQNIEEIITNNDAPQRANDSITVMVVDDSITVRRATTKMLERNNYHVILGKDGEDALEQLQLVVPDIILSDIEMPRMDGFEFAKNIRNTEKYAHIPIIMISSITADKHKNYAFSLGVNDFLGKPYQEDELIAKIKELTVNLKS